MVRHTDGQTDMTKLMVAFHNFVHILKNSRQCSTFVQKVLPRANTWGEKKKNKKFNKTDIDLNLQRNTTSSAVI